MNKDFYAHFHPDERHFVDRAMEWVERAAHNHAVTRTDFLDPRQAFIVTSLVNRELDAHCIFDGGNLSAERKRAIIGPTYRDLSDEDFGLEVLHIRSDDSKFISLEHGDFMGAVLNVGMKRDKVGDIHVHVNEAHIVIASEAIAFMHMQLSQVHRVHVQTEILSIDKLEVAKQNFEEMSFSVASMRLDGILSDAWRLSRAKIVQPIQAGKCRVNWKPELSPSKELREGDVVSLQGFGRFKVLEVEGLTKKGRLRVKIGKYA
ncbi:YlmH/Sll1252 family protein [Paenibacillus sp. N1-5-1-14]|uniref:YlmH family RNA-binding protein n=1 Tax=Paenibacillus radicibacter TaxID=2972488 RepID=UPI002158D3F0|nr:YlmH/Sll1252 family protein [Paenibacillus radicibacter]MCR8641902.1 YlmH/Sll1252 family protein [Paenibacillus radicibacter]